MIQRTLLSRAGSAVVVAATTGCTALGLGEQEPNLSRPRQAAGNETDVRCRLSESCVVDRPPLEGLLSRASENEPIEWERVGTTEGPARDLVDALQRHCQENWGEYRDLYRYQDRLFFISVTPGGTCTAGLDGGDHEH